LRLFNGVLLRSLVAHLSKPLDRISAACYARHLRGGEAPVKRLVKALVPASVLTLMLVLPAHAAVEKTVKWVCDVPGEGLVTFVSAPGAALHGITTANTRAGQTFRNNFGEECTVVSLG
jgi:hypothetical protein